MGIKNLTSIIKHNAPDGIRQVHLSEYRGRILAIDTSIYLYKYMYNGNHLEGFVKQIMRLLRNNITPLYVFDGKPPDEKKEILEDRKQKRNVLTAKKKELEMMLDSIKTTDISDESVKLSTDVVEEPIDSGMNHVQIKAELQKLLRKLLELRLMIFNNVKNYLNYLEYPILIQTERQRICAHSYVKMALYMGVYQKTLIYLPMAGVYLSEILMLILIMYPNIHLVLYSIV